MIAHSRSKWSGVVDRRSFLFQGLIGGAVAGAGGGWIRSWGAGTFSDERGGNQGGPKLNGEPFRLKYLLASSLFGTLPLEVVLSSASKTGAEAVDLWPRPHANHREQMEELGLERSLALCTKYNTRIGALSRYDLGPFGLAKEMAVARELGAEMIVTGCGRGKPADPKATEKAVEALIQDLRPVAECAEKEGVRVAIENHSGTLLATPESVRWFLQKNPYPRIGLALAPYHLPQDPQLIAKLIEEAGKQLFVFYAWQYGKGCMQKLPKEEELEQLPGRGPLDFPPIMAALQKIRFSGWTEIFMHPYPRGVPMLDTPEQIVEELNRSREYLERSLVPAVNGS
jgi:sugar phosphate isomerase/epimerase